MFLNKIIKVNLELNLFNYFYLDFLEMHSVGIHSALAIKRQRKRRDDQRKSKEHRRYSTQSSESGDHSPHGSTRRKGRYGNFSKESTDMLDSKVVTSIGMLHIGVVFVVFGLFLIGAGFLPDDFSSWSFLSMINSKLVTINY